MTKRRAKPSTPEEIAALKRQAEEMQGEIDRLCAQPDVTVRLDHRKRIVSAKRADAYRQVRSVNSAHLVNVDRFEADYRTWKRQEGGSGHSERVDCGSGPVIPITDRSLQAGEKVRRILAELSDSYARTAVELIDPPAQFAGEKWRDCVRRIHGFRAAAVECYVIELLAGELHRAYVREDKNGRAWAKGSRPGAKAA
jgi:hypothetical protein